MKKRKILSMFSGGVDSVGALYRLLTDDEYKDFDIYVHHMHLFNRENRAMAERQAVIKLLEEFRGKEYRPFGFSESVHRYEFMRRSMIWDMDMSAFMAGNICAVDSSIRHVAMGRTKTDVDTSGANFAARMERAQKVFKSVLSLNKSDADYIFPVVDMTKTEVWEMLPEPLRRAAWYCRTPVYDGKKAYPCGRCITCKDMRAVYKAIGEEPPELPKGVKRPAPQGRRLTAKVKRISKPAPKPVSKAGKG